MSYKKFTQQEVADKLNISRQSISKWGNESSTPDIANLIVLASFYKISIQDLTKENKQLKEKISRNNETIHTQQQKLANIRKVLSTSKNNDSWFLLIILLFTFVFAPLNFIILPLVFIVHFNCFYMFRLLRLAK